MPIKYQSVTFVSAISRTKYQYFSFPKLISVFCLLEEIAVLGFLFYVMQGPIIYFMKVQFFLY